LSPGSYISLAVSDTGTGMDKETAKRAVEPFFSTKGLGKGTGLGLSMAHGLARQIGGTLTITTAPDAGTRVEILLPVSTETPQRAAPKVEGTLPRREPPSLSTMTISSARASARCSRRSAMR
jgi:K+-sensing histidine kinase KdpD